MSGQVTTYQCPNCTGPLHYEGSTGKLECEYCGGSYEVAEIEALYAAESEESPAPESRQEESWDQSDLENQWGEEAGSMRVCSCPSCGAQLICEETTAAACCPYCGNPTIVPGAFEGGLKPDCIIPFRLDRNQARQALKKHYRGKRLLPKAFSAENKINQLTGVYVPFWLFDGSADADVRCQATRSSSHREGDYEVTDTRHYFVRRAGQVEFQKIPVDASSKMPDTYMDSLEPFDYSQMKPFSEGYLPGFLANVADVTIENSAARANRRAAATAIQAMLDDVSGYQTCVPTGNDIRLHRGKVHCALLPVYMLTTRWKDQTYLFAMNGQTGKMVSDLPISWGRFWAWFAGISLGAGGLIGTLMLLF